MLNKYSVLMMLLIATAASIIGISSIYQPSNVETQPAQPQEQQSIPKLIVPPKQNLYQQGKEPLTKGLENTKTLNEDAILVDRIMPLIIKKIDGATLLEKIDGRLLAQKVLPYLDLKVSVTQRPGPQVKIDITGLATKSSIARAPCLPEEHLVGGGVSTTGYPHPDILGFGEDPKNTWYTLAYFNADSKFVSYAMCLNAELALK